MFFDMENIVKTPATEESVWAAFREAERLRLESEARFEREMAASRAEMAASRAEMAASRAESEQRKKEWEEKFERERAESRAESDKRSAELAETARLVREVNEAVNGIGKSNGMFAEDFFFTTIVNGDKKIFGEQFDECFSLQKRKSKEHQIMGEQDIILLCDEAVAFVEVKYRARSENIQKIIDKLPNLRKLYPQHDSKRIYLGVAALSFDKGVEETCKENGIAIVKQVGDTVVINDEHLKVF